NDPLSTICCPPDVRPADGTMVFIPNVVDGPMHTGVEVLIVTSSILTPGAPDAATPTSLAARHFSWTFWPLAAAGKLTVVMMYAGAEGVPSESPLQACRPAIGLLKSDEIVES